MQPLVSILIPCYNAGPWISQCIRSALDQTYPHKEVIVVDDGSNDNSLDVIRSFGDKVRVETGPNRGGNVARNRLVHLSSGEWLEFLDADDFLLPQKIAKQIALLENRPDLDVIYAPTLHLYAESGKEIVAPIEDDDLYGNYFRWVHFSTTSLLLKKSAVLDVGGWKEDQEVCQEHELLLRLILAEKRFALFTEALGVNRIQNVNSVSRRFPLKTILQRMALSDRLEAHLQSRNAMTEAGRMALAQARFLSARSAYATDKTVARSLCGKALATDSFIPPASANQLYLLALRVFGFDAAEGLASIRRSLLGTKNSVRS